MKLGVSSAKSRLVQVANVGLVMMVFGTWVTSSCRKPFTRWLVSNDTSHGAVGEKHQAPR
jgi:hypothetical protein